VIVIAFPDHDSATGWYESAAYQEILLLRTENAERWVVLADGVPADHRATDILAPSAGR
jgi:uncharacterized protein (DUF1330 family)